MKVVYSSTFPRLSRVVVEMKVFPEESVVVVVVIGMKAPVLRSIFPVVSYVVVGATYSETVGVTNGSTITVVPPVVVGRIMFPVTGSIVGIVVPIDGTITLPVVASMLTAVVVVLLVEPVVVVLVVVPVAASAAVVASAAGIVVDNGVYTMVIS
jgi:hypothetical protein